jgi:hypothetical protein
VRDAKLAKTIADRLNLVVCRADVSGTSGYYPVTNDELSEISILAKEIEACERSGLAETGCWLCTAEGSATVRGACYLCMKES